MEIWASPRAAVLHRSLCLTALSQQKSVTNQHRHWTISEHQSRPLSIFLTKKNKKAEHHKNKHNPVVKRTARRHWIQSRVLDLNLLPPV